jgi:aminopeptidase N
MFIALRTFPLLATLLISGVSLAEEPFSFATTPGKLPKTVVPEDYQVHVVPDLKTFTLRGAETVRIKVLQPTSQIVLNALELEIESAELSGDGIAPQKLVPQLDKDRQTLAFELAAPLAIGAYTLRIDYRGVINTQPNGLFYSKYPTANGERILLATQLESADARRLLPCWDEPVFRARFKLSGDFPPGFNAYSNMPVEHRETLDGGGSRVTFSSTPKMASYLVALAAGEFERQSATQDGVDIGVVATAGNGNSGAYAVAISQDLLRYYNDYFGIPYPLPKLDQIAIPGAFGGAMENWGAIIYTEPWLLYEPGKSTDSTKQWVFKVVAHEMAHQWFGDLVTMAWWDNLWLNEGFASWMGTKAKDRFNPDWDVWLHANSETEYAMKLDARKTTHPVQQLIVNETEIGDAFDEITYRKGQAVLRMLENYLGEDTFRAGIRDYMNKHQYSSTTTAVLWNALEQVSGKPVSKVAADWTTQPGFPVIKVDATCAQGHRKITLTQQQFSVDEHDVGNRLWNIPIGIGVLGGPVEYTLLQGRSVTLTRPDCAGVLAVDPDAVGYFRVEYSTEIRDPLIAKIAQLPQTLRLKLLADSWALVSVGRLPAIAYFKLLARIGDEPKRAIWSEILERLEALDQLACGEPVREGLRAKTITLLAPKFKSLGWQPRNGESTEDLELRGELLAALGRYGDADVIAEARNRFQHFLKVPATLHPSLIGPVTAIAGRYADKPTYDSLLTLAQSALIQEETQRYVDALAAVLEPKLAGETLQLALSDKLPQIVVTQIPELVARNDHRAMAWSFAKDHRSELLKRVPVWRHSRYLPRIVSTSADVSVAVDLLAYVRANLPPEALTMATRTADQIRFQAKLKSRLLPQITAALPTVDAEHKP